jgi:hypothetical protein
MLRAIVWGAVFAILVSSPGWGQELSIEITVPSDRDEVSWRPIVEGRVSDPNAKVWVIVKPVSVSDFWVQPKASVNRDGTWRVQIYIGRPGTFDTGNLFEVLAVANPHRRLREGDILNDWPAAKSRSHLFLVKRK